MENTEVNLRTFPISDNFRIEQHQKDFPKEVIESHKKFHRELKLELKFKDLGEFEKVLKIITGIFAAIGIYFGVSIKKCLRDKGCAIVVVNITIAGAAIYFLPAVTCLCGRIIADLATHTPIEYGKKEVADFLLKGFWKDGIKSIWGIISAIFGVGLVTYVECSFFKNIHQIPFQHYEYDKYKKVCEYFDYQAFREQQKMLHPDSINRSLVGESFGINRNTILHLPLNIEKIDEDTFAVDILSEDPEIGDGTEYYDHMNMEYTVLPMIQDIGLAFHELKRAAKSAESVEEKKRFNDKADELYNQFPKKIDTRRYEKASLMDHYNLHLAKKRRTPCMRILDPRKLDAFLYDWNFLNDGFKKLQEKHICPAFQEIILEHKIAMMEFDSLAKKYVRIIEIDKNGNEVVILDNPPQEKMEAIDFRLDDPKNWADKKED